MSLFEYVTVMISMILALSLGQLLIGLSTLAKETRKVVSYFPHTLWSICLVLIIVNHWWAQWDLQVIEWDYASFLYSLTGPTLLFFAVGLLAPDHGGGNVVNLKDQFLDIRALFMKIMLVFVIAVWFDGPLLAGQDPFGKIGLLHIPILGAILLGLFSNKPVVETIVPSLVTAALLILMTVRFLA